MNDERFTLLRRIRILKSLGMNYPVLRSSGLIMERIPLIRVEENNLSDLIRLLTDNGTMQIYEGILEKEIRDIFKNADSFLIYRFTGSSRSSDFVVRLYSLVSSGNIQDFYWPLVFVLTDNAYVLQDHDKFFEIFLHGDLKEIESEDIKVIPEDGTVPMILERLKGITSESAEQRTIMAAAEFLLPLVSEIEFTEIKKEAELLAMEGKEDSEAEEVMEAFLDRLQEWGKVSTAIVRELPILVEEEIRKRRVLFFDEEYMYCSQEVFAEIVSPLTGQISIGKLKRCLVEAQLLVPESGNTKSYAVKMNYEDEEGRKRMRVLRFSKELITARAMDLNIIEYLMIQEERRSND